MDQEAHCPNCDKTVIIFGTSKTCPHCSHALEGSVKTNPGTSKSGTSSSKSVPAADLEAFGDSDAVVTYRDRLPTLHANCAYLVCGRQIMQEIFLWLYKLDDIANLETFILSHVGLPEAEYKKSFNSTTIKMFKEKGIKSIDITALWRLFLIVKQFFKGSEDTWDEVQKLLTKIKNVRNEIVHSLLLEVQVRSPDQLEDWLQEILRLVDDSINAFENQYPSIVSVEKKSNLSNFVERTTQEIRETFTREVSEGDEEDIVLDVTQRSIYLAGKQSNLTLYSNAPFTLNMAAGANIGVFHQHQHTHNIPSPGDASTHPFWAPIMPDGKHRCMTCGREFN